MAAPPDRVNGDEVYATWWNQIHSWVKGLIGTGAIEETSFTIANSQGAAADVTGLSFDSDDYRGAQVDYEIKRKTDTASSEVRGIGKLFLVYREEGATWEMAGEEFFGDEHGVTFSVTAAGQVQYTSTNIAGSNYAGTMKFRARTFNA